MADNENIMNQASNIWSMLDDMAETDPQAYRHFIEKQLDEGRKFMQPPNPHMCVKTNINSPKKYDLFINICSWIRVPEPKSDDVPIPVCGGDLEEEKSNGEKFKVIPVAFNENVLKEYGRDAVDPEYRKCLINLAIDFIEDVHKIKVSRSYTVLRKDLPCKGSIENVNKSLMKMLKNSSEGKAFEDDMDILTKNFAPLNSVDKDSLMSQLGNIASPSSPEKSRQHNGKHDEPKIKMSVTPEVQKKGLIEEISETVLPQPEYEVESNNDDLVVRIKLPGVKSVRECELDISEDDLSLEVTDKYYLYLKLPTRVDESSGSAKFLAKSALLTVTLPKM